MPLPNPGMSFTPFDQLPASALNDFVENIESLATGDGLDDGSISPENLVAGTGTSWAPQSWTPTFTNLTVGNGTVIALYKRTGDVVEGVLKFILGNSSSISGNIIFTLPVEAHSLYSSSIWCIGSGYAEDTSVSSSNVMPTIEASTTQGRIRTMNVAGTFGNIVGTGSGSPITWGDTDYFSVTFRYFAG